MSMIFINEPVKKSYLYLRTMQVKDQMVTELFVLTVNKFSLGTLR